MPLENEPLNDADARKLVREIVMNSMGIVSFTPYFLKRMKERGISNNQVYSVLKGGWCEFSEYENNEWRYRIRNTTHYVVIRFESEEELTCISTWKIE